MPLKPLDPTQADAAHYLEEIRSLADALLAGPMADPEPYWIDYCAYILSLLNLDSIDHVPSPARAEHDSVHREI